MPSIGWKTTKNVSSESFLPTYMMSNVVSELFLFAYAVEDVIAGPRSGIRHEEAVCCAEREEDRIIHFLIAVDQVQCWTPYSVGVVRVGLDD